MRIENRMITVFGEQVNARIQIFEEVDREIMYDMWNAWITLKNILQSYGGRSPNLPEVLSEGAWCLYSGSVRLIEPTSADTYNLQRQEAEQIKASSIEEDLTSFGPKSRWDKLYFLDFSRLDGSFDVYEIPTDLILNRVLNSQRGETFRDQQLQGRRPRLSIKRLIRERDIDAVDTNIRIW
ncbi:Bsp6I family restriction endonuclease [Persephonella atlantica]|uniref:Bsp6I family restriction endonuclease n=1 Tax=Persephonella atlantica TaxID=2699429 RepID=A0ABS1GKV0_9AQUI|nr:Bsp6I family type II restriction endonuclease [Persephonella atlantica]MBK3333411.1 Bsp6I family restriction endonuclease [Persephonella atlantica]